MDQDLFVLWSIKIALEPHDSVNFLLRCHVGILGEGECDRLHELSDGAAGRAPWLQVVVQEDVVVERVIRVVQT